MTNLEQVLEWITSGQKVYEICIDTTQTDADFKYTNDEKGLMEAFLNGAFELEDLDLSNTADKYVKNAVPLNHDEYEVLMKYPSARDENMGVYFYYEE